MHEVHPFLLPCFTPVHGAGGAGGHREEGPCGPTTQSCSPYSAPVTRLHSRTGSTISTSLGAGEMMGHCGGADGSESSGKDSLIPKGSNLLGDNKM